jgi:RNA polymerase sigma-70 factor (ECF subfamily)
MSGEIFPLLEVIRPAKRAVTPAMSLEISPAAASWQKRFPAAVRLASGGKRSKSMGVMPSSEAEIDMSALLARIGRTHDVADFELLFRHFAPRVKAYMARTGSAAAAEELMQETMVAVWNKAGLYHPDKGAASTWIFTIARNLRIDAFRRERHPEFDENDPAFQPEIEPAADDRLEGEQSARLMREALTTLPPDQAEVLRLAFFEDKSQSTIATALGVPLGTVKSRMRLAFAKLRGVVESSGGRL